MSDLIHNLRDLCDQNFGGGHDGSEARAHALVKKAIFKYTECGCTFWCSGDRLTVSGYAEGSDAELPPHELRFPFTSEAFDRALDAADAEGVEAWNEANLDDQEEN